MAPDGLASTAACKAVSCQAAYLKVTSIHTLAASSVSVHVVSLCICICVSGFAFYNPDFSWSVVLHSTGVSSPVIIHVIGFPSLSVSSSMMSSLSLSLSCIFVCSS